MGEIAYDKITIEEVDLLHETKSKAVADGDRRVLVVARENPPPILTGVWGREFCPEEWKKIEETGKKEILEQPGQRFRDQFT